MEDRITEQDSAYDDLQRMSVHDILAGINREDARVHEAVRRTIPVMELLVERIVGNHALCRRRTAHGAPSRTAHRLDHLQPRVARSGRSGVCPRSRRGARVRDRIDAHEGRNGPEIDAQHVVYGGNDPAGTRRRQPHGQHAVDQRQARGPRNADGRRGVGA